MSWSTSELRVRLAPLNRFKPSSKIFYWPFQGGTSFVDLLCFCSVLCLLCFVRVCLYVLRGHLLGKGWPLGSRLWCLLWVCHFPIGILGQVWYLIVSIPDLCNLTYFFHDFQSLWEPCSVTSNATCLKIVPNANTFFVYTTLWQVLLNSKERPEIYPETAILSMQWHIKQTVHIRDLTIQTRTVSAIRFHGCSMLIRKPICPVNMANFLYDLGFLCPWMHGYAAVSFNQILDHLMFWPAHSAVTTAVIKVKILLCKLI